MYCLHKGEFFQPLQCKEFQLVVNEGVWVVIISYRLLVNYQVDFLIHSFEAFIRLIDYITYQVA